MSSRGDCWTERISFLRALAAPIWGPAARAAEISRVIVRGPDFREIKAISASPDLNAFREFWSRIGEADPQWWKPDGGQNFKLDIRRGSHGDRWLYDPGGFVRLLGIWPKIWIAPLYNVPTPEKFNRLLGIAPR